MADESHKPPETPPGVPQYAPPQGTQPFGVPIHHPLHPFGYGFQPQPPPPDLKPDVNWASVIKTVLGSVTAIIAIAGIIFAAGKLVAKQENLETSLKEFREQQGAVNREQTDTGRKTSSAVTDLGQQVRKINDQLGRLNFTGRNRARRAEPVGDGD